MLKNAFASLVITCLAILACTPEQLPGDPPPVEVPKSVYFVENATQTGVIYVEALTNAHHALVAATAKVAGEFETAPTVKAVVDNDFLAEYNAVNGLTLSPLPKDLYTVTAKPMSTVDGISVFGVTFEVQKIFAYMQKYNLTSEDMKNYAVSLSLVSEDVEVAMQDGESLGYCLLVPVVLESCLNTSLKQIEPNVYEFKVSVPFKNDSHEFTYDLKIGEEGYSELSQARGNHYPAKYRCSALPEGTTVSTTEAKIEKGVSEKTYTITFPETIKWEKGKTYNYKFAIENVRMDGDVPFDVKGGEQIVCFDGVHKTKLSSSGRGNDNYSGGFNATEINLLGTTLNEFGFRSYADDEGWYWHPQSSCQYGGRDMCVGSLFDHAPSDWGAAYSSAGYGYDIIKNNIISWGVVDMHSVKAVEGIEYWRKASSSAYKSIKTVEVYALAACSYEKYQSVLEYDESDLTYLGEVSFGESDYNNNIVSATFDRAETQYLMILFTDGTNTGYHCIEMKVFK